MLRGMQVLGYCKVAVRAAYHRLTRTSHKPDCTEESRLIEMYQSCLQELQERDIVHLDCQVIALKCICQLAFADVL